MPAPAPNEPVLRARGLTRDYPGVRALAGVDLDLRRGEVHALLGENGAGKSTLIRILSGLERADAGSVMIDDSPLACRSTHEAEARGVSTVFQEIELIPTMSVADNLALGREPRRVGLISPRAVRSRAERSLARLGLSLDTRATLSSLPTATQQLVAIARALDIDARVLILDEPTSSLDRAETATLFAVLRRLADKGLAILIVTHSLTQVFEIASRVTVLRNGLRIGTWPIDGLTRSALVSAMTGRSTGELAPAPRAAPATPGAAPSPVLEATALERTPLVGPIDLRVSPGECVGLAGLLGSGRSTVARLLSGASRPSAGSVRVRAGLVRIGSVRDAIRAGLAMLPEDRKTMGLFPDLSVRENIILAVQARRGLLHPIPEKEQARLAAHYITTLRIRTPSDTTPVRSLSGGNQQKVLIARWLACQPAVFILDDPTRGIDVGARAEIESLIASLCADGLGVVLISSELDEILRLCARVLVLREGRVAGELRGEEVSESSVLRAMAGEPESRAGR